MVGGLFDIRGWKGPSARLRRPWWCLLDMLGVQRLLSLLCSHCCAAGVLLLLLLGDLEERGLVVLRVRWLGR